MSISPLDTSTGAKSKTDLCNNSAKTCVAQGISRCASRDFVKTMISIELGTTTTPCKQRLLVVGAVLTTVPRFRRLNTELKNLKHIDLKTASPKLFHLKHLELAIPGTLLSKNSPVVTIESFQPLFYVLASKQKPRRLKILVRHA